MPVLARSCHPRILVIVVTTGITPETLELLSLVPFSLDFKV